MALVVDPFNPLVELVVLLWGEVPLDKEQKVFDLMHQEGLYDIWKAAMRGPS